MHNSVCTIIRLLENKALAGKASKSAEGPIIGKETVKQKIEMQRSNQTRSSCADLRLERPDERWQRAHSFSAEVPSEEEGHAIGHGPGQLLAAGSGAL